MTSARSRIATGLIAGAAAAGMIAAPAVAHADGTKDPKYSGPTENGVAPGNDLRAPLQNCPGGAEDGEYSAQPSYYPIELGRSDVNVEFTYDAYSIPDKFDILYQGKIIASTGWRGSAGSNDNNHQLRGEGGGMMNVHVPKGTSTRVEVKVTTDINGTEWEFKLSCPK